MPLGVRGGLVSAIVFSAAMAGASPAFADDQSDLTARLCSGSTIGCSITTNSSVVRDATVIESSVIGTPGVRGQVVAYRAILDADKLVGFEPVSIPQDFATTRSGLASIRVTLPGTNQRGRQGGWVFLSLAGQTGPDVSKAVGQFVPFAARIPFLLGDGYANEKPVGQPLEMQFVGAVPNTVFAVEYLTPDGVWQDATDTAPDAVQVADSPEQISKIYYRVPRGLPADTVHEFRLRNLSDSAVTDSWPVLPSEQGVAQARIPLFTPPEVGSSLEGIRSGASHPESAVKTISTAVSIASFLLLLGSVGIVRRRRG